MRPFERLIRVGWAAADDSALRLQKSTLTVAAVTITLLASMWVATYLALGLAVAAAIPALYQVATVVGLLHFARTRSYPTFRAIQLTLMLVLPFLLQWSVGGFVNASAVGIWSFVAGLGAVFFYGARAAIPWFVAFLALVGVSWFIDPLVAANAPLIPDLVRTTFFALNIAGVSLATYAVMRYFVRGREAAMDALDEEHRRSESLLLSILPPSVAARLKGGPEVIAEHHPAATVLFADVVDFTPFAERTSPQGVVALLDRLFSEFDELADRHGLEKIKTIGDSYMAVAGIPEPRHDHVEAAVAMAVEMLEVARQCGPDGEPIELRIGIDSGPVIAGVIGRHKFAYDLWGDTVNTASRMESHGVPGRIQVTAAVAERVADRYAFELRPPMEIKGKGLMTPYLLVGPAPD